ncbi:pilus assembly protein [Kangiella sediminilitoris]|uniref:Tfp pilus assembly protein tip-associated adhesin PilY1-like protein n=1 Tax=Kangiella sediminilitoris TaxID=1144748 RepID=A0A1B3BBB7_9GAMM|nr:PilC/PilY family type IV pilus protein [Kangiella sediminilitoris]AOE50093.1 Tfp pilus assembly protein tip-associated adhesin PilY1-like protein [Kangiella sediminilitoris]
MKYSLSSFIKGGVLGLCLTASLFGPNVSADDTEVYFLNSQITNRPTPKILVAVDYSSAGNGGKIIQNFKSAIAAIANDPNIQADADLGFAIVGKGPVATIVYPAKPADANLSPSFMEAVESLDASNLISGNTPTVQGLSELSRYFIGRTPTEYANTTDGDGIPNLHNAAVIDGRYVGKTDVACDNTMVIIGTGQDNSTSWKDVDNIVSSNYCVGNECDGTHLARYMREVNNTTTYAVDAGATGKNAVNLDSWARAGGTERAIDYDPLNDSGNCDDPNSLCSILKTIIKDVSTQSSSFVQAGVTVSQQNRLNHDNHLYFAQFQAANIARWPGNLKKYKIENSQIVDAYGNPAVDPDTGLFAETRNIDGEITGAVSLWPKTVNGQSTNIPDGNQVALGGAMEQLDQFLKTTSVTDVLDGTTYRVFESYSRNVYTNVGSDMVPFTESFPGKPYFDPAGGMTDEEYQKLKARTWGYNLDFIPSVSYEVLNDDGTISIEIGTDVPVASPARLMGDPLHNVPKVLQYNNEAQTSLSFVGTNLGYLHAVDMSNGKEAWSFIPNSMLSKMQEYMANKGINGDPTKHNYGLDGEMFIAHADTNGNLRVDSDETALLLIGMRRGGDKYFVLDVSNPAKPDFRFILDPSTNGLGNLGDTWSMPLVTNIDYYDQDQGKVVNKTVIIFGGGYDDFADHVYEPDEQGNYFTGTSDISKGDDVFIYDLSNPGGSNAVLWQFSDLGLGSISSVASNVRGVSLDNDSTVDHLYISTIDGKVYRADITPDETNGGFKVNGGIIFDANDQVTDEKAKKRFYYAPSIAFIPRPAGKSFVAVAVGSGYRPHPLGVPGTKGVPSGYTDTFYMVRDTGILKFYKTFGKGADPSVGNAPIVPSDLVEADTVSFADGATNDILAAQEGGSSLGWYMNLPGLDINGVHYDGEKVITESRILFGKIVFTTYVPTFDVGGTLCSPVIGSGKLYGVNLVDGTSFFSDSARSIALISDGIPPLFQLLYTSGASSDGSAGFISLVGNEVISDDFTEALTKGYEGVIRVNWRKKPDEN